MTEIDVKTLALLPAAGWFSADVLFLKVKNPEYRLQRLVDAGKVEWRVVGDISSEIKYQG